ncbi:archaellin/type IV pilin N-terminal domain-containing protein [Methanolobus sp. ZRKC5]|uniref:archaellin/type IV pilin N-terminal domain-containing protein n=1 Tax=Methanolobus sp. ZRKC5 TaxID=3136295 RepID=UPI00313AD8CF
MKANKRLIMKKDTHAQVGIGTLIIFIAMVLVAAVAAAVLIQTSGVLQQKAQSTGKQATQEVSSNLMVKGVEGVRAKNSPVLISNTVDLLKLKVGLNVGSAPVDVNQVVVSITDGTTANNLVYAGNKKSYASTGNDNGFMTGFTTGASVNLVTLLTGVTNVTSEFNNSDHYFTVEKIRDEDASFSQNNPVMNTGDLITLYIATTSDSAASTGYSTVGSSDVSTGGLNQSGLNLVPRTTVNIVLTPESGAATTADFVAPSSYGVKETVQLYP